MTDQTPTTEAGRPCFKCGYPEYPSHHDPLMPQWEDHPFEADLRYPPDQTPRTEAGRLLDNVTGNKWTDRILATEAEARAERAKFCADQVNLSYDKGRADALREAAERVRALPVDRPDVTDWSVYNPVERFRAAVIAILTETER